MENMYINLLQLIDIILLPEIREWGNRRVIMTQI